MALFFIPIKDFPALETIGDVVPLGIIVLTEMLVVGGLFGLLYLLIALIQKLAKVERASYPKMKEQE